MPIGVPYMSGPGTLRAQTWDQTHNVLTFQPTEPRQPELQTYFQINENVSLNIRGNLSECCL